MGSHGSRPAAASPITHRTTSPDCHETDPLAWRRFVRGDRLAHDRERAVAAVGLVDLGLLALERLVVLEEALELDGDVRRQLLDRPVVLVRRVVDADRDD